jgi:putative DNA primase/helicase
MPNISPIFITFGILHTLDNVIYPARLHRKDCVNGRVGRRRFPPSAPDGARVVELWPGIWESDPRQPWEPPLRAVGANVTPFPSRPALSPADFAEAEKQFRDDLRRRGLSLGRRRIQYGLPADGSWPRADVVSKGRSGLGDGQYIFNRNDGWPRWTIISYIDGRGFQSGVYNKSGTLSEEQKNLRDTAMERGNREADEKNKEQERQWAEVAERCRQRWADATEADPGHAYLRRKAIKPFGVKQEGADLLVPMYGPDGLIWSLQTIPPEPGGRKMYAKGGRTRYGFYTINDTDAPLIIFITEGFATASSIAELTDDTVIVAFDCNRLGQAGEQARRTWPEAKIIFAADDDWKTIVNDKLTNVGLRAAREAAYAVNGFVAVPEFPESGRDDKDTDFNDLRRVIGDDDAVRASLANAIPPSRVEIDDEVDPEDDDTAPQYSEEALALAFAAEHKDDLRYVAEWGKWFQWDGNYWRSDKTAERDQSGARAVPRSSRHHQNPEPRPHRRQHQVCQRCRAAGPIRSAAGRHH